MKNILWWGLELLLSCLLIMNEKNRCSSVHREQTNCTWLNQMVDWTGTGRSYFMQVHKWRVFHVTEHQEALSFTYLDYWPDFKGTQEPIKKKKKKWNKGIQTRVDRWDRCSLALWTSAEALRWALQDPGPEPSTSPLRPSEESPACVLQLMQLMPETEKTLGNTVVLIKTQLINNRERMTTGNQMRMFSICQNWKQIIRLETISLKNCS